MTDTAFYTTGRLSVTKRYMLCATRLSMESEKSHVFTDNDMLFVSIKFMHCAKGGDAAVDEVAIAQYYVWPNNFRKHRKVERGNLDHLTQAFRVCFYAENCLV